MGVDFWGNGENFKEVLNSFGQCTGEYYFLYRHQEKLIYFSDNVCCEESPLDLRKCVLTREEWHQAVDPRDRIQTEKTLNELMDGRIESYNLNYRIRKKNGDKIWINSRCRRYPDAGGKLQFVFGCLKGTEEGREISVFGNKELKKEIKQKILAFSRGYLLLLGIDNLKAVNLSRGRDFGDGVLEDVGRVLRDELPGNGRIYRLNGDCFSFHCDMETPDEVQGFFANVQERLEGECTVSAGCVSYRDYHVDDGGTLLQYAETAMEQSKANGKNRMTFFLPEDYEKNIRELELKEELKQSVEHGFEGFSICYQPQIYTDTGKIYGAEALLRYESRRRGVVAPTEVIPVLEQSGMICPVGLWVLKEALACCKRFRNYLPEFHISVNISYIQLNQETIGEDVLRIVRESGVPGSALTIEVTESNELADYPHVNALFRRWKREGVSMSVDDFGTGYSSLGRLKNMEVDEIKIDRCFVREIQDSAYNYRLLSNIIELADSSMIHVCCEGVETAEELQVLRELHPRLLQGYLISCPVTEEKVLEFLKESSTCSIVLKPQRQKKEVIAEEEKPSVRKEEAVGAILDAENDIYYLSDMDTYELYYLNPAGQKLFGVRNYSGRKCYRVLNGREEPCAFCNNDRLCQDRFFVWENQNAYCGRHFMLKDKMLLIHGKRIRMEAAKDITRQEVVSQGIEERLQFARKITGYMNTLENCADYSQAVERVLASVGNFYQSDRAYLFERDLSDSELWHNTFEWCAESVTSEKHGLQNVSAEILQRWIPSFEKNESVVLMNIEPLQETYPLEWKILKDQEIQRLIAVPIRDNGRTIGFVGVDNPRYSIHDDSQIRVLAGFLLTRMRQDHNESRYQKLLQDSNQDLLEALQVGFWTMDFDLQNRPTEMTVSDKLEELLALRTLSAKECCQTWYERIPDCEREKVDDAFRKMAETEALVQQEHFWNHPERGRVLLRLSGILKERASDGLRFKGYLRLIEGTAR